MKTTSMDSVPRSVACSRLLVWRRALAVLLIALLSPFPALMAFWANSSVDESISVWVDPASGHVFTLAELDAFSDDIDGDGLSNWEELQIGTNPFLPDTDGDGISDLYDPLPLLAANLSLVNGIAWGPIAMEDADGDGVPNFFDPAPYGQGSVSTGSIDTDGDGIPDDLDPAPWDSNNLSPFNGLNWMGDALGDADGDGVPNFYDWYPYDSSAWEPSQDADGDGLLGAMDPRPDNGLNPSPVNWFSWPSEVYGDYDGDGIPNFYDPYPYVSCKGVVPMDADGDGIPDSLDPSPWDYYNYSAANGISWLGDANGDADGDGITNFYDQFPYDYYNGNNPAAVLDTDGDGIPDAEDPAPYDPTNFSPINGGRWYSAALADADGDGNPNFTDPWPYDPTNGITPSLWDSASTDTDGDGIPNSLDPALADPTNFSIYNGTSWYGNALGDIDGDGIPNFRDAYPYDYYNGQYFGPDSDGDGILDSQDAYPFDPYRSSFDSDNDGIPDSSDPAPNDPTNLSPINGIAWYGDALGDADGDGVLNFWDLEPYGPPQIDTDGDGLIDSIDPAPTDPNNYSTYNMMSWPSNALGDADGDGIPNFFDPWPYDGLNGAGDADSDGLPNALDPAPSDYFNYSPYNHLAWSALDVFGDWDNDGILNFFDAWPFDPYNGSGPNGDADGDGILNKDDPAVFDRNNVSPFNGFRWGLDFNEDADGDGIPNYWDPTPYGVGDMDGDGIPNDVDPTPNDGRNYSSINSRAWYGYALGDDDLDQIPNFSDPDPEGGMPYEPDPEQLPTASASRLVLLNDGYEELGEIPAPGATPARDFADVSLAVKAGPRLGSMSTKGLTMMKLYLPYGYLAAGGSVTITKAGKGAVRIHAVRTENQVGVEEHLVPLSSPYVPPASGAWDYWIEGVAEGDVTLTCYFPQAIYGWVNSQHPRGVMANAINMSLELVVCAAHLSVDRDRDGKISPGSYSDATFPGRPFRFWVNDDQDFGEAGDSGERDVDGTYATTYTYDPYTGFSSSMTTLRANSQSTDHVDGSRDLVDFFPVSLDIQQVLAVFPPDANTKYKLKHADSALNFTYTNLARDEANDYHKKVLDSGFGLEASQAARVATTWQVTAEGVELSPEFLKKEGFSSGGVILVEGRAATDKPLVVVVEKDGVVIAELSAALKICAVEEMYRHADLTGLAKEYDGASITPPKAPKPTNMGEPSGLPDSEMNDKYFIFVHGFNVDGQSARGWNSEVFKRLYVLGSRARFVGVTWNGTPPSLILGQYIDYHKGVFQAFQAGDGLAGALGLNSSDVTVAAHSLGNMVVSHAIQSGNFQAKNYFMINAAVPMEAYVPAVSDEKGPDTAYERMTEDNWKGKDDRLFASNWHRLFNEPYDCRAMLTWKGVFVDVMKNTSVTNFYSPGEDVVENPKSSSSAAIKDMWDNRDMDKGAWGHQEMIKGTDGLEKLGLSRVQGGWGFDPNLDLYPHSFEFFDPHVHKAETMFLPFLEYGLFRDDGSQIALVSRVKYDVLARGIPAMSYAVAPNPLSGVESINMEKNGRIAGKWPTVGHDETYRAGRWIHSDFKNVALPYVYPMFQKMIDKGALDSK